MAQSTASSHSASFWREMESFKAPEAKSIAPALRAGSKAPSSPRLPLPDGRLALVVFLRHCGCPFAEKTFKTLTGLSYKYSQVRCIAVSHSSAEATEKWIPQVGGVWDTDVIVDPGRDLYAQWGLGVSSTWHVFNPRAFYSAYRLGADEGVWNRPTESGNRWQTGGAFAIDRDGTIRWAHVCASADDLPDLEAGIAALGVALET